MLKKIMSILLVGLLFIPMISNAKVSDYNSTNLKEALIEEGIESNLGDYEESDDKVNVYLFRGNGCTHCRHFLEYLNEEIDELGKYFNLVSFEVFGDAENANLFTEVSTFMGKTETGVPYIVIGDKTFSGFGDRSKESVKNAIIELYETNEKDRYDVFEEMEKENETEYKDNSATIIVWNAVFTVLAVVIILFVNNRKILELKTKIDTLEKSIKKKSN